MEGGEANKVTVELHLVNPRLQDAIRRKRIAGSRASENVGKGHCARWSWEEALLLVVERIGWNSG